MFEGYVTSLLLRYGRRFIKDLPDLKLSLWGGDVELKNLQLRVDAIERIFPGSRIYIKSGILQNLNLHIPWTSLTSSPIVITIEGLHLEAVAIDAEELPEWVQVSLFTPDQVQQNGSPQKPKVATESKEESGWGSWMIRKISNNIALRLKNLHVTLQHKGKLCTIHIDEIFTSSCDHLWEEAFVDPGKLNFMRKFCSFQGLHCTLNDCDESGEQTKLREPVLQQIDFVVRAVFIKDRTAPNLPDNRVDILCLNAPSISLTVEQYNSIIQILKLFLKKKKRTNSPKAQPKRNSIELHQAKSTPSVYTPTDSPITPEKQKGWFSWVVSTLTEEQDQEMETEAEKLPSVYVCSIFAPSGSLKVSQEDSSHIFSLTGKRWALEIVLREESFRPFVKLGVESISMFTESDSQLTPLHLLQAQTTLKSSSGSPLAHENAELYDYTICIPFSLYDKRQTVTYAIDLMHDTVAIQNLIDHEIAFGRVQSPPKSQKQKETEYNKQWEQFNAFQIAYSSTGVSRCFELILSPSVSVLDISTIQEIISFFTPISQEPSNVRSPGHTKEKNPSTISEVWKEKPPMKIIIKVQPSRLYVMPLPCESTESQLTRDIMVYVDHMGISFSNEESFPTAEELAKEADSYSHNLFHFHVSTLVAGFAVRDRAQAFSKDQTRCYTKNPLDFSLKYGKGVLRDLPKIFRVKCTAMELCITQADLILCAAWLPIPLIEKQLLQSAEEELFRIRSASNETSVQESYLTLQTNGVNFECQTQKGKGLTALNVSILNSVISFGQSDSLDSHLILRIGSDTSPSAFSLFLRPQEPSLECSLSNSEINFLHDTLFQWLRPLFSLTKKSGQAKVDIHEGKISNTSKRLSSRVALLENMFVAIQVQNCIFRLGEVSESLPMISFLLPHCSVITNKSNHWKLDTRAAQLLLEDIQEPANNVPLVKELSVSFVTILKPQVPSLNIEVVSRPIHSKLTSQSIQIISQLMNHIRNTFQAFTAMPRITSDPLHRPSDNTKQRSSSLVEDWLSCTEGIEASVTIESPAGSLQLATYSFSYTQFVMKMKSSHIVPNGAHSITFRTTMGNVEVSSLHQDPHSLLQLVDQKIFVPSVEKSKPFLDLSWSVSSTPESLAVNHNISLSVSPIQMLLWFPVLEDIGETWFHIRKLLQPVETQKPSQHARTLSWQKQEKALHTETQGKRFLQVRTASSHSFQIKLGVQDIQVIIPSSYEQGNAGLLLAKIGSISSFISTLDTDSSSLPSWKIPHSNLLPLDRVECVIQHVNLYGGSLPSDFLPTQKIQLGEPVLTWLAPFLDSPVSITMKNKAQLNTWESFQIESHISDIHLSVHRTALRNLLCSWLSTRKYLRLAKFLLQSPKRRKPESPAPKENRASGISLSMSLGNFQIRFLDEPHLELLYLECDKANLLLELGIPHRVYGSLVSFYVRSQQEGGRVVELIGREREYHSIRQNRQEQFLTVQSICNGDLSMNTININVAPVAIAFDATLANQLVTYFRVPISRELVVHEDLYNNLMTKCKELVLQYQSKIPVANPILLERRVDASQLGVKILVPFVQLYLSSETLKAPKENSIIRVQIENFFLYYSTTQDDAALSISSIQCGVGKSMKNLSQLFSPPLQGTATLRSEVHDKAFYRKRVFVCHTDIPLMTTHFSLGYVHVFLHLAKAFQKAIASAALSDNASKPSLHKDCTEHINVEDSITLSPGDLKEEGLFLEAEKHVRPPPNGVSISRDATVKWFAWKYNEPRSIQRVQIQPFPSESAEAETVCDFRLFYFDIVQQQYVQVLAWKLLLPHSKSLSFPLPEKELCAKEWKLEVLDFPFPSSLLPMTCLLPSYYKPSFSSRIEYHIRCQSGKVSFLCPHPTETSEEELFSLYLQNSTVQCSFQSKQVLLGCQTVVGFQYIEPRFLTSQWFLEPNQIDFFMAHKASEKQSYVSLRISDSFQCNFSPSLLSLLQKLHLHARSLVHNSAEHTFNNRHYYILNQTTERVEIAQRHSLHRSICGDAISLEARQGIWFSWPIITANAQQTLSLRVAGETNSWSDEGLSLDRIGWQRVTIPLARKVEICWVFVGIRGGDNSGTFVHIVGSCVFENLSTLPLQLHLNQTKRQAIRNGNENNENSQPVLLTLEKAVETEHVSLRLEKLVGIISIQTICWQVHCSVVSDQIQWQWSKPGLEVPCELDKPKCGVLMISQTQKKLCAPFVYAMCPGFEMLSEESQIRIQGPMAIQLNSLFVMENFLSSPLSVQFAVNNESPSYQEESLDANRPSVPVWLPYEADTLVAPHCCLGIPMQGTNHTASFLLFTEEVMQSALSQILKRWQASNEQSVPKAVLIAREQTNLCDTVLQTYLPPSRSNRLTSIHVGLTFPFRVSNGTQHDIVLVAREGKDHASLSPQQLFPPQQSSPIRHIEESGSAPTFCLGLLPEGSPDNSHILWSDHFIQLTGSGVPRRIRVASESAGLYSIVCKTILRAGTIELLVEDAHSFYNHLSFPIRISFDTENTIPCSSSIIAPGEQITRSGPWKTRVPLFRASLEPSAIAGNSLCHWTPSIVLLPKELTVREHFNLIHDTLAVGKAEPFSQCTMISYNTCNYHETLYTAFFEDQQGPVVLQNQSSFLLRISPPVPEEALFLPFTVPSNTDTSFAASKEQRVQVTIARDHSEDLLEYFFLLDLRANHSRFFNVSETCKIHFEHQQIGNTSIITLSEQTAKAIVPERRQWTFDLTASHISLSLIDDKPTGTPKWQEVVVGHVDGVSVHFSSTKGLKSLHFSAENYQIESATHQHEKVICCPQAKPLSEHRNMLDGIIILQGQSSIWSVKCLSLSLLPFTICADDELVYSVLHLLRHISFVFSSATAIEKQCEDIKRLPSKRLAEMTGRNIYIHSLHIDPIRLEISAAMTVGMYLSLDRTPISFPALTLISKTFSPSELAVLLTEFYITSTIYKVPQILASIEILGNPGQLVRQFASAVQELFVYPFEGASHGPVTFLQGIGKGFSSFFLHTSQGAFSSLYSITSSISRNLEIFTFDREYQAYRQEERALPAPRSDQKLLRGVKGFSYGVATGVMGVVSQPVIGGYQQGMSGFFSGLGKGLIGAVAKPVGGAAELLSCTSAALLQSLHSPAAAVRRSKRWLLLGGDLELSSRYIMNGFFCPPYSTSWLRMHLPADIVLETICLVTTVLVEDCTGLLCITLSHIYLWNMSQWHQSLVGPESVSFRNETPIKIPISLVFSSKQLPKEQIMKFEALHENKLLTLRHPNSLLRSFIVHLVSQLSQKS